MPEKDILRYVFTQNTQSGIWNTWPVVLMTSTFTRLDILNIRPYVYFDSNAVIVYHNSRVDVKDKLVINSLAEVNRKNHENIRSGV